MNNKNEISIDLGQMIIAIENAVSLVGMNDTNHGKRVGYIALQIANHMGFEDDDKRFIFELGMLHDCGVSSDYIHNNLINQFDWEDSQKHCDIGYNLLKNFKPLSKFAVPIKYHHTHWKTLKDINISLKEKRLANLIFLADRVDVSSAAFYRSDILLHSNLIRDQIVYKKSDYFDVDIVESFIAISKPEAFWLSLEDRHINKFVWDMGNQGHKKKLSMTELKELAQIFSYIVDQKSTFTAEHSLGVARLSKYLAEKFLLPEDEVDKVEVAGYLHDIGKLHIPDKILEKPGPLNRFERASINQHSYETYEILRQISGLEEIAKWAAYHHDNCIGTGYPFHPPKTKISIHARIIAVADVFQALIQDRPYRKGLQIEEAVKILKSMCDDGKLDENVVETVCSEALNCYKIAKL